jgi:heptosyltransferase-1
VNLRALRRNPFGIGGWQRIARTRRDIRSQRWDYVIDAQGLIKSAMVSRFARAPSFGPDPKSARDKRAARFYDVKIAVPRQLHAVERSRRLVGEVFGYRPEGPARYGIERPAAAPEWAPTERYIVMLHAASRAAKRWPEQRWIDLGRRLSASGYAIVLPGGTPEERAVAARIAAAIPNATPAPAMTLAQAAALLGYAEGVVGVDTGLTHLAVALGVPTVGIYCATRPELTGLHGAEHAFNVGDAGQSPTVEAVAAAIGLGSRDE